LATIGLSMIVKNGGDGFRSCLESARPLVDEIVIVDTGSTDNSVAIAREFGAIIVDFPWCDDFAAARNAALAPVTTDWVLVLDADEELSPEALVEIRCLVDSEEDAGGYTLWIRSYVHTPFVYLEGTSSQKNEDDAERARSAPFYKEFACVRLFRRHPRIFYTGCVHEIVNEQVNALGMQIKESAARIRHYGRLWDDEARIRKQTYYRELGHRKVNEEPLNVNAWYLLGLAEFHEGNDEEALRCMTEAFTLSHLALPLYFIAAILYRQKKLEGALKVLSNLDDAGDIGMQKNHLRGKILHDLNRLSDSRCSYRKALEECEKDPALSVWQSSLESQLGYVEVRLGNHSAGMELLRRSVAAAPGVVESHDRLIKACIVAGDEAAAADAAEAALTHFVAEKLFARAAALRYRLKQPHQAQKLIETGLHLFPKSVSLRQMQA
jgi:glycosyltransferase involved in cell wall biosynthesis